MKWCGKLPRGSIGLRKRRQTMQGELCNPESAPCPQLHQGHPHFGWTTASRPCKRRTGVTGNPIFLSSHYQHSETGASSQFRKRLGWPYLNKELTGSGRPRKRYHSYTGGLSMQKASFERQNQLVWIYGALLLLSYTGCCCREDRWRVSWSMHEAMLRSYDVAWRKR